jgi:ATP-binding cassette, subfamily B, bacterial PglK
MQVFKNLYYLLNTQERKSAGILIMLAIIIALLDMIGVASILPFMAVLLNPDIIETNNILNKGLQISKGFGVENNQQFLLLLGATVFVLLIVSLTFKAIGTYATARFIQMREYSIGKRLIEGYLHQPYSWFLNRNSADLGKTILSEISQIIGNGLRPLMELISKGMVTITIVILLFLVNPKLALIVGFSIGLSYGAIFYFIEKYLNQIGKKRLKNNLLRFTAVSEALGAVKEIKISGLEKTYIKRFSDPSVSHSRDSATAEVLGQLPRFVLEGIIFGGIFLVILYLMSQTGKVDNALPIISLYVFAGYRLMPALQQIYASLTSLSFIEPSLKNLTDEIQNLKKINFNIDQNPLSLTKEISLKNINYNYPNTSRTTLKNISINIPAKKTFGIIGPTGCGKTTTVDIILGLLEPQKGTLEIDGQIITKQNLRSWQKCIGYVPQHIYLSDNTVAANIAFGVDPKNINKESIEKASKIANLHEFVTNELPKKYKTNIGERGVRLSGGQRQRIGIARALYHNPQVLILDEATSALDNATEKNVMDMIGKLSGSKTIIIIAHRLTTIQNCDYVIKLNQGKIESIKDNYKN